MDYEIQIKDIEKLEDELVLQHAERDSIELAWLGGNEKDRSFVGSELNFTMETTHGEDGKYLQYFTSDEKKWRVDKVLSNTGEVILRAYLLPESYEEPYANPLFYNRFSAVDGLGLLKGKTLSAEYYSEEKSSIDIIAACLRLTKIDFDIYLSPAILNVAFPNWKDIHLDTSYFYREDKLLSAYDLLHDIVKSMRCQLFQCEGRWYIEGINIRQMLSATFYKYSIDGEFLGTIEIQKNIKELTHFIGNPTIKMVPALGRLTVSQQASMLSVPKELAQDNKNKWIVPPGVDGSFIPIDNWRLVDYFKPLMEDPDQFLTLEHSRDNVFKPYYKIELRKKPYILKGTKIRFNLAVKAFDKGPTEIDLVKLNRDELQDSLVYKVSVNDKAVFYNLNTSTFSPERLSINEQGEGQVQLEFIASENGFLNIELFQPYGNVNLFGEVQANHNIFFQVKTLSVEDISQRDRKTLDIVLNEKSSIAKEIDLPISDDITANSNSWRLEKLRELDYGPVNKFIELVKVNYNFEIDGVNYAAVSLRGAVVIENYPTEVRCNPSTTVPSPKVHYNFNGSGEMVIETGDIAATQYFMVHVRPYKVPSTNRLDWIKWSDAVYSAEAKEYSDVVASIEARMYETPHLRISGGVDMPLKYNDILKFRYKGEERFFAIYDLTWRPDDNLSTFVINEALYAGGSVGNLAPFVDAGPDLVIPQGGAAVQVTEAAVSDGDGQIVNKVWTQISGPTAAVFSSANALNPLISNLIAGEYIFELSAEDEKGLIGSDQMRAYSRGEYDLTFAYIGENTSQKGFTRYRTETYQVALNPAIPANSPLLISFDALIQISGHPNFNKATITVLKNSAKVFEFKSDGISQEGNFEYASNGAVQYQTGDIIEFKVSYEYVFATTTVTTVKITTTAASFIQPQDNVVNISNAKIEEVQ